MPNRSFIDPKDGLSPAPAQERMLEQLRTRRRGYSLPRAFYSDPAYFQLDMENIYYREWLFAGHDCEVAKPGDFFTVEVGEYSIIVLRKDDGEIVALHNTCRHRGSRICLTEYGSAGKRLICPYHQWTYYPDGRLATARHMSREVATEELGLKAAHCESVAGCLFICLAETSHVEPYLLPHRLREAKVALKQTIVEKGNWKLVWENNRECYHCAVNHPELCLTYPEKPTATGVNETPDDPEILAHWERCEAAGLPSRFKIAESGQYRTARMPLLGESVSYTMDGNTAVAVPLCRSVTEPKIGTMLMFHYPTMWNHILGDHAVTFRVLPLSATETQLTTKWLVNKDAVEGVHYDLTRMSEVWVATNNQDRKIVQNNQLGILSPAYEPGPYSLEHEGGVMQFVDWYSNSMGGRLERVR
jgi:glycine betaine catabolism A